MKKLATCVLLTLMLNLFSSCTTKQEKAFKVFNEGVSFSLDAAEAQQKSDIEKSTRLNKQAIEKFRETLKIDSSHKFARSALGHSLYLDKQFKEAIYWFEKANKTDIPNAGNFRELGLCEIDLGQIKQGREAIEKAFKLDTSKEIRRITVEDLLDIGTLAFNFGKKYISNGDKENGENYRHFSIAVLKIAFDIDANRKDISKKIGQYANELPDKSILSK